MKTTRVYCITVPEVKSPKWVLLCKNQGVGRTALLLEALEGNSFPCLFQLLEVSCFPYPMVSSSTFKASNRIIPTLASMVKFPSLTLTLLSQSFMVKDPCDYIGPSLIVQHNLPISRGLA